MGQSSPAREQRDILGHITDLNFLLGKLDVNTATLCGHSLGAYICAQLAAQDPGLATQVILTALPPTGQPRADAVNARVFGHLASASRVLPAKWIYRLMRKSLAKTWFGPDFEKAHSHEVEQVFETVASNDLDELFFALDAWAKRPAVPDIASPVHIIAGSEDRAAGPSSFTASKAQFPNAQFSVINGAGHLLAVENNEALVDSLKSIMQSASRL